MNPSAEQVGIFILIALMLIPAIDTLKRWATGGDKNEISPQPLIVKPDVELVPEKHFKEHKQSNHEDHSDLFKRVGTVEIKVGALENADVTTKQRLVMIDSKLDRLLERGAHEQ